MKHDKDYYLKYPCIYTSDILLGFVPQGFVPLPYCKYTLREYNLNGKKIKEEVYNLLYICTEYNPYVH